MKIEREKPNETASEFVARTLRNAFTRTLYASDVPQEERVQSCDWLGTDEGLRVCKNPQRMYGDENEKYFQEYNPVHCRYCTLYEKTERWCDIVWQKNLTKH